MRYLHLAVVSLVVLCVGAVASASVLEEDFESYAVGSELHGQGEWKGWDNTATAGAPVSDLYAYSGTNSVEILGTSDLVHEFDVEGGVWIFRAMQYIPSGGTGVTYFILLNSYDDGANQDWSIQTQYNLANGAITTWTGAVATKVVFDQWIELKYVIDLDNNTVDEYYNGIRIDTRQWDDNDHGTIGAVDLYGNSASSVYYDDIVLLSLAESQAKASAPVPTDGETDVVRDVILGWTAGTYAASHDVYFGTDAAAVGTADRSNPMDVLAAQGHSATSFDPAGLLEYGQTYYWRVDEVNATPDTIFKGPVWSFTAEPYLYPVQNIIATSNTEPVEGAMPERTIDGSGLDESDLHSQNTEDMWLGVPTGAEPAYIQYAFDGTYKLAEMLVWNYNTEFEKMLGFGLKDVTIETSEDGQAWTTLGDYQFAQATTLPGYAANTTVDMMGVTARYVRIVVGSGYGMTGRYGLSEVRFLYKPVRARGPEPADGASGVEANVTLNWRPGREAVSHQVVLSADPQAVADGTALVVPVTDHQYATDDLELGQTYYWRVDEVNEAETIATWEGRTWSFTTQEYIVVDDFESYTDDVDAGQAIFDTWEDGWVNDSGSTVGYFNAPFTEQTIVTGGRQSMPLEYDNTSAANSEATRTFSPAQDWTAHGVQTLLLYFRGDADNTRGRLYLKINGTKVPYDGDASDLTSGLWQAWMLDLSAVSGNLASVKTLTIGIEDGGTGMLYVDDIRLYAKGAEAIPAVSAEGMLLHYTFDEGTGAVAADASGNGNDGAVEGTPAWVTGVYGTALEFDGTQDYVTTGQSLLSDVSAFSIACWIKGDLSLGSRSGLVGQNDCVEYGIISANALQIWTPNGGSVDLAWPVDGAGEWHHVTAIGNGSGLTIYLDGSVAATGGSAVSEGYGASSDPLNIGGGGVFDPTGNWFTGQMDDVYVYQRALTGEEILWLIQGSAAAGSL